MPAGRERFLAATFDDALRSPFENNPLQYQVDPCEVAARVSAALSRIALLYLVTDDDIVVTACIHSRRDPRRWHDPSPA